MPIVADNPRGGSLTMGLFSNRTINIGIVTEIVLLVLITEVSVLQTVFHTAPLGWDDYVYLCCIPFVILGIEELRKHIWRHSFPTERVLRAPPPLAGQVAPRNDDKCHGCAAKS